MQFGGDPDQAGQYQPSGLHYIYYHIYFLFTRGWATSSRDKLQVEGLNLHHKAAASRGGRYSAPWAPSQLWWCTQPRAGHILTKWNASWECWKLSSMYCRTDNAPSLTMGYSNLEKTWWVEKKKQMRRQAGITTWVRRTRQEREVLSIYHTSRVISCPEDILRAP